ncbi:MAG: spore maturation protein [Magnetococcales bacterium]|nr:spore maturation protein [Magnetococcales bacterium]
MNAVFVILILGAILVGAAQEVGWLVATATQPLNALTEEMIRSAKSAVDLSLGLIGIMAFFLGLMKIVEQGGALAILARLIRPLLVRLFPQVPAGHPAMGAMIMNISANMLGLGNAATPFGIRAMQELDRLNPHKGTASDAMTLFLAINTSGVTLFPTSVMALRASLGSQDPAAIVPTTLIATLFGTVVSVAVALWARRFYPLPPVPEGFRESAPDQPEPEGPRSDYPPWITWSALVLFLSIIPLTLLFGRTLSPWVLPGMTASFLLFGLWKRVRIYEAFVEGAKEGFQIAVQIIPYLVAILVAVGMFRASGALGWLVSLLGALTTPLGLPPEALPMALLRPFSGSGAYGVMTAIMQDPRHGPDSYVGLLVSTLQGASETTFYVLAVYFGAVRIQRIRQALLAGLAGDVASTVAAVVTCSWLVRP